MRYNAINNLSLTRLFTLAFILTILAATGRIHASDSVTTNVEVKGTVSPECSVDAWINLTFDLAGNIANSLGKANEGFSVTKNIGKVSCNYHAYMSVKSTNGALITGAEACNFGADLLNCVKYDATLIWNSQYAVLNASGTEPGLTSDNQQTGPYSGDLDLEIALVGSGEKQLLAGNYQDLIIVQIGADL